MARSPCILIACSEAENRQALLEVLSHCGLEAVLSASVREARRVLSRRGVGLVFCASHLKDGSFQDVLRTTEAAGEKIPVVVTSRVDNTSEYLEAMRSGAFDYVACPYQRSELERIVSRALQRTAVAAA